MKELSGLARVYIVATILLAIPFVAFSVDGMANVQLGFLAVLGTLAALGQIYKVEGSTTRSSYNIAWIVYGFAFVLFGLPFMIMVILIAHVLEWIKHKYPWYIQAFNATSFIIASAVADFVYLTISGHLQNAEGLRAIPVVAALAAFTLINHISVGLVISLARQEDFSKSGVMQFLTLMIDYALIAMGAAAAFVWAVEPYAAILTIMPLYLVYATLKLPSLERKTRTDEKTGLYNSTHFREILGIELQRSNRFDRPMTVVVADLDLLRNINNSYGHIAGDEVLMSVADTLRESFREYDVVARIGGEEFAVLMPETTPAEAFQRVETLRKTIEAKQIEISTHPDPITVTLSFGIAERHGFDQTVNELIHAADLALYHAKIKGRNRTLISSEEDVIVLADARLSISANHRTFGDNGGGIESPAELQEAPANGRNANTASAKSDAKPDPARESDRDEKRVKLVVGGFAIFTAILATLLISRAMPPDWLTIAILGALVLLSELFSIEIYARDVSVSTSAAPIIAGALMTGPIGAVILGLFQAGTTAIKHRSKISRFIFNFANQASAGLLAAGIFTLTRTDISTLTPTITLLAVLYCTGIIYLTTTSSISLVMGVSTGSSPMSIWIERFRWLAPHYAGLGLVGFTLIFAMQAIGIQGVVLVLVPLIIMRYAQVQYVQQTKTVVKELNSTNKELRQKSHTIQNLNEELLLGLSKSIDLRDPFVHRHSEHVSKNASLIAEEMGLPQARVEAIRKAGLLHDIGKLGIPEAVLLKSTSLTKEEYEVVKRHSVVGAEIMEVIPSLKVILPFVRHHHERYDGRGYPDGLQGSAIPLEARILALADSIEAMASDRPYRKALSTKDILAEVEANAGTQFDPGVVKAFMQLVEKSGEEIITNSGEEVKEDRPRVSLLWGEIKKPEIATSELKEHNRV